jgi:hypothetical protein
MGTSSPLSKFYNRKSFLKKVILEYFSAAVKILPTIFNNSSPFLVRALLKFLVIEKQVLMGGAGEGERLRRRIDVWYI